MKHLSLGLLLCVLISTQAMALKVDKSHNCFGQTNDQLYILPDSDELFFPLGSLKLAQFLIDFPSANKVRDDYYIVKAQAGFRAGFHVVHADVAGVQFEPKPGRGEAWDERCQFVDELKARGLTERYLVQNPYQPIEKQVLKQKALKLPAVRPEIISEHELSLRELSPNQVILIPDEHGDPQYLDRFLRLANLPSTEWFGLEIIPDNLAETLQIFLKSSPETPEFKIADAQMIQFFSAFWLYAGRGLQNPYYQLLWKLKSIGKPVYAMDAEEFYSVNSHYESQIKEGFFFFSRNANWASHLPPSGRGIVFGGAEHFALKGNTQFQDFYRMRSESKLYELVWPKSQVR